MQAQATSALTLTKQNLLLAGSAHVQEVSQRSGSLL